MTKTKRKTNHKKTIINVNVILTTNKAYLFEFKRKIEKIRKLSTW